jgi:hypothetical protein
MSDGGKGSTPRPYSVDQKTFDNNWELAFGKKKDKQPKDTVDGKEESKSNADKDRQD